MGHKVSTRDHCHGLLLLVAVACFVAALLPGWSSSVDPATGDRRSEWRLGVAASPLYRHVRHDHELQRGGGFKIESGLNWFSWSMLLLLLGSGCVKVLQMRSAGQAE